MTSRRSERRRARREKRLEGERRASELHALLASTTAFGIAAFLIGVARPLVLKFEPTSGVLLVDLSLTGVLFMCFGLLSSWFARVVRERSRWIGFAVVASLVTATAVWTVTGYRTMSEPARAASLLHPLNPEGLALPISQCATYSPDPDMLVSLGSPAPLLEGARVSSDEAIGNEAAKFIRRLRHEKELLRQEFRSPTMALAAKGCMEMGRVGELAQIVKPRGVERLAYVINSPYDVVPRRLPEVLLEDAGVDDRVVVNVSRDRVTVWEEGVLVGEFGACDASSGSCRVVPEGPCAPSWDPWAMSATLEAAFGGRDEHPNHRVVVDPDVPLQHVLTFHDVSMGAFESASGACTEDTFILPDGSMFVLGAPRE